jgi:hypothetical protein
LKLRIVQGVTSISSAGGGKEQRRSPLKIESVGSCYDKVFGSHNERCFANFRIRAGDFPVLN